MPTFVVDASVAAAWCFPDEGTEYTNAVLHAVLNSSGAIAPRLWAYELRNSVLIGARRGRITKAHALDVLASLQSLQLFLTDPVSYDGLLDLADKHKLTIYDTAYLDLALREALPLASLDSDLCKAAEAEPITLFQPRRRPDVG
jgi:predicted nucleic acid-binding protein